MFKNTAGQKVTVFAFDATTNLPTVGGAANLTAYVDKDGAGVTVLADTTAAEKDATNAKGYYEFDLAQAETNADKLLFSGKSSTANVVVIACPPVVYTTPPNFSSQNLDSSGRVLLQPAQAGVTIPTVTTLTNDPAGVGTLLARLTAARAGYLDNVNVGGPLASQADVLAINQSASRRIIVSTVAQYERPEAGLSSYEVEIRTYDPDGSPVDATDGGPFITATGIIMGDISNHFGGSTNPATGVKRFTFQVSFDDVLEQVRFDVTATLPDGVFTLSAYTQIADFVAATWTTADRTLLQQIDLNVVGIPPAIWEELLSIHTTAGTAGAILGALVEMNIREWVGGAITDSQVATTIQSLDTRIPLSLNANGFIQSDMVNINEDADAVAALLVAIPKFDATISSRAIPGSAMTLTAGERVSIASAVWSLVVDGATTAVGILRGLAAMAFGTSSGGGGSPIVFKSLDGTKNRISATCDVNGNRTAVVTDLS